MTVQLIKLVVYFAVGTIAKGFPKLKGFHQYINSFIFWVCIPSLALVHIPKISFSAALWMPVATAWIVFAVAVGFFVALGWLRGYDRPTIGCLILTCGLLNSAFIGLPVVEMLYGETALPIAILVDQLGSFLALSTAGTIVAVFFSSRSFSIWSMIQRIVTSPPLWGFGIALTLRWQHLAMPISMIKLLSFLASMLTPLALISVGMQLKWDREMLYDKTLFTGLFYKLLLAPTIIFLLYAIVLGNRSLNMQVSVMQAAMAPMISGGILATTFGLNAPLASRAIGLGIPLSTFTLALWFLLLESVT